MPAHLFNDQDLAANLLSPSDLTNEPHNAECRFHKHGMGVYDKPCNCGNLLAFYPKNPTARIWSTSTIPTSPQSNFAIKSHTSYDFVQYYHAIFGSPPASTFYRAVRNKWITIKDLSPARIFRNWPNSLATAQGHMQQMRQGVRSTSAIPRAKRLLIEKKPKTSPDFLDTSENTTNELHVRSFNRRQAIHVDATGRYPEPSIDGFEYLLIFVYKNYIHVELLRDRSAKSYILAYTAALAFFADLGHIISNVVLDNETSAALESYLTERHLLFQLVSPGNKRSNRAERAIQSWRNHMISTLGTVNPKCPTNLWSKFIPQMEICLAQLRPFEDDPTISSYDGIYRRQYDHNAHPLSICGSAVLVFETPESRPTWSTHGVQGFYLGPSLSSYRSYRCWISSTKSERSSDTVQFFPAPFLLPGASKEEQLIAAIDKLAALPPTDSPALTSAIADMTKLKDDLYSPHDIVAPNQPDGTAHLSPFPDPLPEQRVPNLPQPHVANPLERKKRAPKPTKIDNLRDPTHTERARPLFKRYESRIGHLFRDTETDETFIIESIQMPLQARGKGSQTPHYIFTDARQQSLRPQQRQQEFTSCHELEHAPYVQWLAPRNTAFAILSKEPYDGRPLNQRGDGLKFTFTREAEGPRGGYWRLAKREEYMRLLDTNTILPVYRADIPNGQVITYYNPQLKEKIKLSDTNTPHVEYRVRGTYGGNRSNYSGPVSNNTAEYPVVKILMNATLSDRLHKDPNTKFATADMVDFYLGTDLDEPGYMSIQADDIGNELIDLYNLSSYIVNVNGKRYVYFKVAKCLYGHPAAGRLSFHKLKGILEAAGFIENPFVDCLFKHNTRNIQFALIVDDMGIKYSNKEDLDYLISVIEPHWKLKVDLSGSKFLGMHLVWEYDRPKPRVLIFNPTVVRDALARFAPNKHMRGRTTPSPYTQPVYGLRTQHGAFDDSKPAPPETIKFVQEVTGLFNHYSRVIDYTMAEAVTAIARTQAAPTEDTLKRVHHLLNYAASHPYHCIIFEASDMILTAQSDASYQSIPGSRSKAGGVFYFANANDPPSTNNGLIGVYSKLISVVCAGASDAEYAALFQIAQLMYFYRIVTEAVGYPQQASPIYVDNDVARGIADRSVKVKRSKSIDKSFHYIRDRVELKDIVILRVDTNDNLADFFTKALPPQRHVQLRERITQGLPTNLRPKAN